MSYDVETIITALMGGVEGQGRCDGRSVSLASMTVGISRACDDVSSTRCVTRCEGQDAL